MCNVSYVTRIWFTLEAFAKLVSYVPEGTHVIAFPSAASNRR